MGITLARHSKRRHKKSLPNARTRGDLGLVSYSVRKSIAKRRRLLLQHS